MTVKRAVVLLSGGLDSATTLAIARCEGFDVHALTFLYGQRHQIETEWAGRIAQFFAVKGHTCISIPAGIFSSALVQGGGDVPKNRDIGVEDDIPDTYVPARNILFLSYALAFAESWNAERIYIGANAVDYSGYPDCRPEFFTAFNHMAAVGTKAGVMGHGITVVAPLISMKKSDIILRGHDLGVDFSLTRSCYDPLADSTACGECDSCRIRRKGFADAGLVDPIPYRVS